MRTIIELNRNWRFFPHGELSPEVRGYGNLGFFADETRSWQKVGNHAVAKADNPHTASWRRVDLPHDFVIEGEFTRQAPANNGSLKSGEAWYVKLFSLEECDAGRRVHVEFDGIYRNSMIFCNGQFIGRHLSGYTSFSFDLTEVCNFGGENAIAIYADARENELWSYEGGGIYRGVRLVLASSVAVTTCELI